MSEDSGRQPSLIKFLVACGLSALVWMLAPGLEPAARMTAAVFVLTVALWMTEAIPLAATSLLGATVLVITGTMTEKDAFGVFGNPIILLFIGSFMLARAMEDCGLDQRIAYLILARKWATKSAATVLFWIGLISCVISLFVSNTATTAMLLPVGLTILKALNRNRVDTKVSWSFLLMLTWSSSIAVGTIIGTPPNVIGVALIEEATGVSINFVQWAIFAMPITAVMLGLGWLMLTRWGKEEKPDTAAAHAVACERLAALGRVKPSEWAVMACFSISLAGWLTPGLLQYILGAENPTAMWWDERMPEAVAALAGACLLFVIPVADAPGRRALSWSQAAKIDWGTVLLFAGGLALGKAAFDSGLAQTAGEALAQATGVSDVWAITALAILMAIALSELASNTASASTVVPVVIALSEGAGVSPLAPALGAVIGANLGFMLPISTAPNAIVYSSGLLPAKVMMRAGFVYDLAGFAVTWVCLRVFLPMMGLA
jgi:sodium-dependent dicarboxylate transporter 2/3/5